MLKRGISPILSTILLVGFVVILAGVVANFLITETEEKFDPEKIITESEFCSSVALGFEFQTDGTYAEEVSYIAPNNRNTAFMTLRALNITNKGTFTIRNITVIGQDGSSNMLNVKHGGTLSPTYGLKPQESKSLDIIYMPADGQSLIQLIPWIKDPKGTGKYILCEESSLTIDISKITKASRRMA